MKKVLIIILDGCRADMLLRANTPNIDRMIKEGFCAQSCLSVFPTLTGPAQLSILTGAYPETTGIIGHFYWNKEKEKLIDINGAKYCQAETLFDIISQNNKKNLIVGPRVVWFRSEGYNFLNKTLRSLADRITANQIIMRNPYLFNILKYIRSNNRILNLMRGNDSNIIENFRSNNYSLFYLVFDEPDQAGHEYGPEAPQYLRAIELCDKKIGMFMNLAKKSSDETVIIVTSDHGQTVIHKKVSLKDVSLEKIGYKISEISHHPIGREVRIIVYNKRRDNMALATFVTRHMQLWLHNTNDVPQIINFLRSIKGVDIVATKDECSKLHLKHDRLSDITLILKKDYGFDTNEWAGDHGGLNEEDINVPLVIWGKGIPNQTIKSARLIDIAPTVSKILGIRAPRDAQGISLF
jgi:predicted AlkP superfamily pyrophosphatase or phosphodiesterase